MQDVRSTVVGGVLVLLGVALGAVVFRSEPAGAQAGQYRECVVGRQESVDINGQGQWDGLGNNFDSRLTRIPPGWEVVSGGGSDGSHGWHGHILICRR